ncbi:MAG: hypothetical protein CVU88_07980, partial [Firmicutes bacterium HGW-Firmicutes-13]
YHLALKVHAGQKRISGEVYIIHPLGVAQIIADLELDPVTIAAGLLHDVVEDTEVTLNELKEKFGEEIGLLVDGVTKLSQLEFKSKEEQQAENLRKMFVAMAKDIRVILIKLADRLHNMRTLKYLTPTKRKEIARETLEIYAPLAHRLGIYKVKWELEDLAFRFLEPDKYYNLVGRLAKKRKEREEFISRVITNLKSRLDEVGIKGEIQGRPKHLYGIYEKMNAQDKDINEIYDLTGIRLIVDSVKDCYGALGIVHTLWKPIPGRFKDHIAMPKPNMYQSLHTTVVCAKNELLEVQIRTLEMHRTAEYGIAAHWRYKEGVKGDEEFAEKLSWLRQLLEWQQDLKDAHEFMENLKIDLFTDEVFVFTPKGDVIDLPAGAVPLDFAYRIHTDIGHRCVGAKVNGRLVPLNYQLKTGDIMEIITSKHGTPSRDWLKIVKSSQAKSKIRSWFKKEKKEEVKVVAYTGRESDLDCGIWGEIARQLGKEDLFASYYSPLKAPGQSAWINLLKSDTPTLIMLDELPPYLEYCKTQSYGTGTLLDITTTALANLFNALNKEDLYNVCLVISDLRATYQQGSRIIQGLFDNLENEMNRSA